MCNYLQDAAARADTERGFKDKMSPN
jgi:hypothetical protein